MSGAIFYAMVSQGLVIGQNFEQIFAHLGSSFLLSSVFHVHSQNNGLAPQEDIYRIQTVRLMYSVGCEIGYRAMCSVSQVCTWLLE